MKRRGLPLPHQQTQVDVYERFQKRYWADPAGFVANCINWPSGQSPAPYQLEVLQMLVDHRRVSVRGPHGLGKTTVAAMSILWFALTRDGRDWKIATTASAWVQLASYLWPEVFKWMRRLKWTSIGRAPFNHREALQRGLKLDTGLALSLAPADCNRMEGAHAAHLLYIFDEAKIIPPATWDATEGAFSTGDAMGLAISTPGEPSGRFYDIHARRPGYEDWQVIHVTKDDAISAGMMNPEWAEQRKLQWGEGSAVYQNRVEGEFAAQSADGVIPLAWVELANQRWLQLQADRKLEAEDQEMVGVDVGRTGDKTVIARRFGKHVIVDLRRFGNLSTMQTVAQVQAALTHGGKATVDVIGIGAGVFDRLRELGLDVAPFGAGERTSKRDRSGEWGFENKRAASWWNLRELLDPELGEPIALPPDDMLTGDLVAVRWREKSGNVIGLESKDAIKARLQRSPDDGDAVVMAFWKDYRGIPFG